MRCLKVVGLQPDVLVGGVVSNEVLHTPRHVTDKSFSFVGYDLYLIGIAEDLTYCQDYKWEVTAQKGVSTGKSGYLATGVLDAGP